MKQNENPKGESVMLKFFNKKKDNKGFTLVELVIVVAILAILVGVLAPQYTKYVEKSRKAADVSNLENLVTAFKVAASDGTTTIPIGKYYIVIGETCSKVQKDGTEPQTSSDANTITEDTTATKVIKEFAGDNWGSTKLKSSKWTTNNSSTDTANLKSIYATCEMKVDGSVIVSYSPAWMTSMSDQSADKKE